MNSKIMGDTVLFIIILAHMYRVSLHSSFFRVKTLVEIK